MFFLEGDVLEDDEDYLADEFGQPVVSDSELGGDDSSDIMSASTPASKSPALAKKKQHPTYKGSPSFDFLGQGWKSLQTHVRHLHPDALIVSFMSCRAMHRHHYVLDEREHKGYVE